MNIKLGSITFDPSTYPPGYVFPEAVEDAPADLKRLIFPGGFYCYAPFEADEAVMIYNEIMVKEEYFQYGLSVAGAKCVLDVGANIGMFTMAVKLKSPDATVHAFEPVQDTFQVLDRNARSHGWPDVHTYNVAIGSQDHTEREIIFYPRMPGNSSANLGLKVAQKQEMDQIFGKEASDFYFVSESRHAQVRTLSSIIQEQGITGVDYLKIDVEGDELLVLDGIAETHWPIIKQVVVEAHNELLQQQVCARLAQRGFETTVGRGLSSAAGPSSVYARRAHGGA